MLAVVVGGSSGACERCWLCFGRYFFCGGGVDIAFPPINLYIRPQVPDLEQAMDRCVYAESIAGDLLNGTGKSRQRRRVPQNSVRMRGMILAMNHDIRCAWIAGIAVC